jgi:hypothetical protein
VFPFAFAALNFAHRSFVALEIFALAAAGSTRFTRALRILPICQTPERVQALILRLAVFIVSPRKWNLRFPS